MLRGHGALITGAGGGIGRALVEAFRDAGAQATGVDVAGNHDVRCDVSDESDVVAAFDAAERRGPLTDVVCAAAVAGRGTIAELERAEWQRVIDVNLTGAFLVAREAVRRMSAPGTITMISSYSGRHGTAGRGAYCASKFAMIGLVEALAREVGGRGIRVNAVLPYGVDTPMADETFARSAAATGVSIEELRQADHATIALGRYASPAEIADTCLWLASDLAGYVNGASIAVDGAAR